MDVNIHEQKRQTSGDPGDRTCSKKNVWDLAIRVIRATSFITSLKMTAASAATINNNVAIISGRVDLHNFRSAWRWEQLRTLAV